jgi:dTDP-4-dehydrorhamnose 3,5-epimerase
MEFEPTAIPEVVLIKPQVFEDARGHFFESWTERKFAEAGLDLKFVQDNENRSEQHVLRGVHYQLTKPQGKLVRVVTGAVFDVAVDLRRRSPTFGRWVGAELSADNHLMVLSQSVHFLYKCTQFYYPQDERAIRWDDADLGIVWPLPAGQSPVISARDAAARAFREAEYYP